MKSAVVDPATSVMCARIETVGGSIFRFAYYPHDLVMSNGETYIADPFYEPSDLSATADLSPSVFDSKGFFDATGVTRDQLLSGLLDNAKGYAFTTSWAAPVEDERPEVKTIFGKSRIQDDVYYIENMSLEDAANQSVGTTINAKCTYTLFDETLDSTTLIATDRSRCTGPRSAQDGPVLADYLETGTVTGVTSNKLWTDSSRAEAAGYFDYGSVLWLTGDNAGLRSFEIKTHATGGVFTQHMATHYAIQVGDTYKMIPGCDHKRSGDCINKYNNAINCNAMENLITEEEYADYSTG
jgi:hypothetical protein